MRRRFPSRALAATAAVIVAIAGGVTYAVADIGGSGVINGCYKSQNGQLRLIDPATDSCRPSETAISWSQTGPAGTARAARTSVRPRQRYGLSSTVQQERACGRAGRSRRHDLQAGAYEVIFNRNVSTCAFSAVIGNPGAGLPLAGDIVVATRAGNDNGVFVATRDNAGTLVDRNFHLEVFC